MITKINDKYFFDLLVEKFPSLKEELSTWDSGAPFFKMEVFADYTKSQVLSGDRFELQKCFDFLESKIEFLNPLLLNALNVSYCESLLLGGLGNKIDVVLELMGPNLINVYREYEKYYNDLGKNK